MELWWYIALGVYVAVTVSVIVFLRTQRRRAADDGEARCGSCGYRTRGLPTSICPECGQDLNVVGTRRPTYWNRLSPTQRRNRLLGAWTFWIIGLACVMRLPFEWFQPGTRWLSDNLNLESVSGPYAIEITRAWRMRSWMCRDANAPGADSVQTGWAVVIHDRGCSRGLTTDRELRPEFLVAPWSGRPGEGLFVLDVRDGRYAYVDSPTAGVLRGQGSNWRADLGVWLDSMGTKRAFDGLRAEVEAVLDGVLSRPYRQSTTGGSNAFRAFSWGWGGDCEPDAWWVVLGLGLLAVVWIAGCWRISRRHRTAGADLRR
jgi:ribosomal protein L34E